MTYNSNIKSLLDHAVRTAANPFRYEQIIGLPAPVQRYFKFAIPEGTMPIRSARLRHEGQFKTGLNSRWSNIKGEEYFTTSPPGFVWRGKTRLFNAQDLYIAGQGRLMVKLFSFLKIIDAQGPQYDQGELARWLSESVWFPTALLPSTEISWSAIDDHHSHLTFTHQGITLIFVIMFNAMGEISRMETKRYRDPTTLDTWIIHLSEYRIMNGIQVPTKATASWAQADGEFVYADFRVLELEYDAPWKF